MKTLHLVAVDPRFVDDRTITGEPDALLTIAARAIASGAYSRFWID